MAIAGQLRNDIDETMNIDSLDDIRMVRVADMIHLNKILNNRFKNHTQIIMVSKRSRVMIIYYLAKILKLFSNPDDLHDIGDVDEFSRQVSSIINKDLLFIKRIVGMGVSFKEALDLHL